MSQSKVSLETASEGKSLGGFFASCIDQHACQMQVVFWKPDAYWHMHNLKVHCPHCGKPDNVCHEGWVEQPRRICGMRCTFYLYSYRYRCKKCPGASVPLPSCKSALCQYGKRHQPAELLQGEASMLMQASRSHLTGLSQPQMSTRCLTFPDGYSSSCQSL